MPFFYFYPLLGFKFQQYKIWEAAVVLKIIESLPSNNFLTNSDNNVSLFKSDNTSATPTHKDINRDTKSKA
jgi:hypothetical protein